MNQLQRFKRSLCVLGMAGCLINPYVLPALPVQAAVSYTQQDITIEEKAPSLLLNMDLHRLLLLAALILLITVLVISAFLLLRSIRREDEEEYENGQAEERKLEAEEELGTRVMRKSTPLPQVPGAVDSNMLDSQIRNFVVDDIGEYLDEEKEEDQELAELEEELEAARQYMLELQMEIEERKKRK